MSESISLGYVATRIIESAMILVGAMSLLSVVTLQQDFAASTGADGGLYVGLGKSLVALHDWTFLFRPAFCAGLGNGILLGYLMYRSELVPSTDGEARDGRGIACAGEARTGHRPGRRGPNPLPRCCLTAGTSL